MFLKNIIKSLLLAPHKATYDAFTKNRQIVISGCLDFSEDNLFCYIYGQECQPELCIWHLTENEWTKEVLQIIPSGLRGGGLTFSISQF